MSRQVDTSKKLSEEDRNYLLERGRRYLVVQNDRRFGSQESGESPSPAPQERDDDPTNDEWEDQVAELTVAELRDELSNRGLDATGNKSELQKRLVKAGPEQS